MVEYGVQWYGMRKDSIMWRRRWRRRRRRN